MQNVTSNQPPEPSHQKMTEQFLYFIWKHRLFDSSALSTTDGEKIEILRTGNYNTDAGPDFFNAKIRIGGTLWAGNVEIHLRSSSWYDHCHDQDRSFENVILHVVYNEDKIVLRKDKEKIPALDVSNRIDKKMYDRYEKMLGNETWIPCANLIGTVPEVIVSTWLERLAVERLERKSDDIIAIKKEYNNDWAEVFYILLSRSFGLKVNAQPFEFLAKSLPYVIIAKHKDDIFKVEALLFGQAGMLNREFTDEYPCRLRKEYVFLKKKYGLEPVDTAIWKFLRMRPSNFPTVRIAQFASLMYCSQQPLSEMLEFENADSVRKWLDTSVTNYWETHYLFDKSSPVKKKHTGRIILDAVILNAIVPFIFSYGKYRKVQELQERALHLLEQVTAEKNSITNNWSRLGITSLSAAESQALLLLKNEYCTHKKCLDCNIGNHILKSVDRKNKMIYVNKYQ